MGNKLKVTDYMVSQHKNQAKIAEFSRFKRW